MTKNKLPKKNALGVQPRFLVSVDGREHSKVALHFACSKAKALGHEVSMVHVIDPVDYNTIFSVADVIKEERIEEAKKLMRRLQNSAKKLTGISPKPIIREGMIDTEIIACVEEDPSINMLIVGVAQDGTAGKTGVLFDLTREVGYTLHLPVMIVPGNLTDQQIEELS